MHKLNEDTTWVRQGPCDAPTCNSRKGKNYWSDGSAYCFSCRTSFAPEHQGEVKRRKAEDLHIPMLMHKVKQLPHAELKDRGINREVAEAAGVRVEYCTARGTELAYYYPIYDGRTELLGYQVRALPKHIKKWVKNKGRGAVPFGGHKFNRGRMLVVTEGAEDKLAADQMLTREGKKYRVVATLGTSFKRYIDYFEQFDSVVFAFDQQPDAMEAAAEACEMLSPGKGRIMHWEGEKDPNDLLRANRSEDFLRALNDAKVPEIGGVITGEDAWVVIRDYTRPSTIPYPPEWEEMARFLEGMREAEISMHTAGSGIGKTSMLRRIKQHVVSLNRWKVAEIELEEKPEKTIRGMMEFHAQKRLRDMTDTEKRAAYEATYGTENLFVLNHRSQAKGGGIMPKLSYLHHGLGANVIFLDHITLGAREFGEGASAQSEMMEQMLAFVERTGVHLALVSHLRKSPSGGKAWATGAVPTEEDMLGSSAIYQISADVIGYSRNKQAKNEYVKNCTIMHSLKNREDGNTGNMDVLYYDKDRRLILPADMDRYEQGLADMDSELENDDAF